MLADEIRLAKSAGVDEESVNRILAATRRHPFQNENKAYWMSQVRTAAQEGLPASLLINKIEEGVAKNIEPERINTALAQVLQQLRFAGKLIEGESLNNKDFTPAERNLIIARMSELLSAGLTQTEMRHLYTSWKSVSQKQKLEAMTFYAVAKQAGLSSEEAGRVASAGIEHNHFHSFPLELSMMIKAAKANKISNPEITSEALKVVSGEQTVQEAHRKMNIHQMYPNPSQVYRDDLNNNAGPLGRRGGESRFGISGNGSSPGSGGSIGGESSSGSSGSGGSIGGGIVGGGSRGSAIGGGGRGR
uniref:Uncharacterized protein n=1 Tax=uncultured Desulfobacterium sp. TaxID=201089 RepID=E1YDL8_9BACT|nr:hypothetical protein N47_G39860 [uncultured Desulfobacterium sp.]